MNLVNRHPSPRHRQSMLFGLRALVTPAGTPLPPPSTPRNPTALEPWVVALLVFLPPVGLFVWWRRYRRLGPRYGPTSRTAG